MDVARNMLEWNKLSLPSRYAVLGMAQLPARLAFLLWSELSKGEQDALYFIDWHRVLECVSKDELGRSKNFGV